MDDLIDPLRALIAIGLTMLLALLRLDAQRFGTAEYFESVQDMERHQVRRRLTWYGLGIAHRRGDAVHPSRRVTGPVPRVG